MDNEKRLIIAIALSVVILVAFAWLAPKPERQPQPVASEPTTIEEPVETRSEPERLPPVLLDEPDRAARDAEQDAPVIAAEREEEIRVDNGVFQVVFTNRGGRVRTWTLADYTTSDGAPLQLFPQFEETGHYPLSVDLDDAALTEELNNALYRVERERLFADGSAGGERIKFIWSDGRGLVVEKTFEFRQNDYLVDAWLDVIDRGRRLPARLTLGPAFAAQEPSSAHSNYYYESQGAWLVDGRVTRRKRGKLEGEGGFSGSVYWAGLEDQYFTSLILPNDSPAQVRWKNLSLTPIPVKGEEVDEAPEPRSEPVIAVSVTGGGAQLFIGPKKFGLLKEIGADRKLQEAVWFSSQDWLRAIVRFLFMCLVWIHDNVTQNWGLAIVMATVVLRLVLFPVNQYSMVNMKKTQLQMQKLQPKIKAIRNKYKKAKDAQSKGKMNQEMMELYKREGVNPMGGVTGCLPLLAQFPILIGFYNMLTVAVELRGAPFFGWIQDLSKQDPAYILPVLMAVTMLAQQKLAMSKIKDPQQLQQQRMMLFMPIVFGFICLQMPSGLVLYWFVNNLLGMGQQWLVNRHALRLEAAEQKA
jgi:YidC/Oxa1 family membrane protein insertase